MWLRWTVLIILAIMILACIIGTTYDWIKGKTGPLGPHPENWWGCGVFTLIIAALMWWVGRPLF